MGIQEEKQVSDISMHEVIKDVVKLSELLEYVDGCYSFANSTEKEQITRVIFLELSVSENTFSFSCKNGFQALETRLNAVCGPLGWLSELLINKEDIKISVRDLDLILK